MWPCTRTLLFWKLSTEKPWEAETRAVCQCSRDLKDLGVRQKGALRSAPHYCSCQIPSTDIRGPTVARGFYLELDSAARRWLILHSYHFAPLESQLLSPCHHADSVAATLQFLPNQSSPWQGLSPELRPGGSWDQAQSLCVPLRVAVCYACAAFEGAPTVCGMQCWACWKRGLPKGRGGKGAGSIEKEREEGGDLWTVPSGSYDSIFNRDSKTEHKSMEIVQGWKMEREK